MFRHRHAFVAFCVVFFQAQACYNNWQPDCSLALGMDGKGGAQAQNHNFMSLPSEWLFCCSSDHLQRCAKAARIDSRAGPPAPSERPLIRRASKRESSPSRRRSRPASPRGFLTQGLWTPEQDSSLQLERRCPNKNKFVGEASGLAKPMAACHDSEAPPCMDWDTLPPLPSIGAEEVTESFVPAPSIEAEEIASIALRMEALHSISDLVEPDESPELPSDEEKKDEILGRTRVLMANVSECNSRRSQDTARIQSWFESCGLEHTLVTTDLRQLGESALSFAQCCKTGDTCALILTGLSLEVPEEERGEEPSSQSTPMLADFWVALPAGVRVVIMSDCEDVFPGENVHLECDEKLQLLAFALVFPDVVPVQSRSSLFKLAMLQAADSLSLADGPCKLTCLDFFEEMTEQAEDLAAEWGCDKPLRVLQSLPDPSLVGMRWPLSRAPREMAREVGVNNMAATQTWIRTGAVPKFTDLNIPELHRPRPRSESPPRERPAAAEQLAAAGVKVASAAFAATAAAVVEAGSATVAALVDAQHSRSLGGQHVRKTVSACEMPISKQLTDTAVENEERGRSVEKRRLKKSKTSLEKDRRSASLRSMPQNFGSLELMLSGGGALKKPKLPIARQPKQ